MRAKELDFLEMQKVAQAENEKTNVPSLVGYSEKFD